MIKIKDITKKESAAIAEYKWLLLKSFSNKVRKLLLFGSKARGTSRRDSDVDLLVVVTKNSKHIRKEIVGLTHEPIVHFGVWLSPITIEEKELKHWSPFLQHIKEEGVTLWTAGTRKKST